MSTDIDGNVITQPCKECICMECGLDFEIKDSEGTFYIQRGLSLPKRCAPCRAERKAASYSNGQPLTTRFNTSEVECNHCTRLTVVPFTPREGSAVYCRVCWEGVKNVGTTGAIYV